MAKKSIFHIKKCNQKLVHATHRLILQLVGNDWKNSAITRIFGVHRKATAMKQGQSLNIIGKYRIQIAKGELKVSFDPDNGKVWYIFDALK